MCERVPFKIGLDEQLSRKVFPFFRFLEFSRQKYQEIRASKLGKSLGFGPAVRVSAEFVHKAANLREKPKRVGLPLAGNPQAFPSFTAFPPNLPRKTAKKHAVYQRIILSLSLRDAIRFFFY